MDGGPLHKQPWARPVSLADVVALVELVRESAVRGARDRKPLQWCRAWQVVKYVDV